MSDHMVKAAKLTADMIQRRDDWRRIRGPHFETDMDTARPVLRGVAERDGLDLADAALMIAKQMDYEGVDPSIIIATFVEECEAEERGEAKV